MNKRELKVGDVAKRAGVAVSAVHFYEAEGLIKSGRNQSNHRVYKAEVLRRIGVVKAAQAMGVTLAEIKQQLATLPDNRTPTQKDWARLAKGWQVLLDARINRLQNLRDSLDSCIGCGCLSLAKCPLYNPNDQLGEQGAGAVKLN